MIAVRVAAVLDPVLADLKASPTDFIFYAFFITKPQDRN